MIVPREGWSCNPRECGEGRSGPPIPQDVAEVAAPDGYLGWSALRVASVIAAVCSSVGLGLPVVAPPSNDNPRLFGAPVTITLPAPSAESAARHPSSRPARR